VLHRPGRIDQRDFQPVAADTEIGPQSAARKALAEIRDDEDRAHAVKAFAATHGAKYHKAGRGLGQS
jgi:hypothetical protein